MNFSDRTAKKITCALVALLIGVISAFICADRVPDAKVFNDSIERLDETKETVMKFSAATLAVSVGITLLPDDYATPLASELADLNKYFILILGMIFFEKLMVVEGVPIAFRFVIPLCCFLYILYLASSKEILKSLAVKLFAFAMAMVIVVPCATYFSDVVCAEYQEYIDETINMAEAGNEKINELSLPSGEGKSFFERVSDVFQTAITGVKDLFDYFSRIIEKCINSIAILIVVSCGVPVLTFMLFIWIFKQLFQIQGVQALADRISAVLAAKDRKALMVGESEEAE